MTAKPLLLEQLATGLPWLQPTFAVSDRGHDAVIALLAAAMVNCQNSNLLDPPGCPLRLDPAGLVDGTVVWGHADLSGIKLENFDPYRLDVMLSGEVTVPITVQDTAGGTKHGEATNYLSGIADLSKTPPAIHLN